MDKLKTADQFLFDECIHFLADLNDKVDKRGHEGFDYMASDARDLASFILVMIEDLKKLEKKHRERRRVDCCCEHE